MQIEFTVSNPSEALLNFLFPYRSNQAVKKDLRKHVGNKYYNLSLKRKLELNEYWRQLLNASACEKKY